MTKFASPFLCLALVIGLAVAAGAQTGDGNPINENPGADVIVGDLPGVSNYTADNGFEAYSVGTTSCNIGTVNLLWIANNNQHPVIGQSLYRAMNNRFEMVGQSWLKHGFTALTQSLCDPCSGQGGSVLGVGCSDPYGSGLNGQQSGLGPKWQVNAATGGFTYPFAGGVGSGSTYKRVQVALTDLAAGVSGGASWFVEGHYVTPDDAAAHNHYNNVSHRPATISMSSSTSYPMGLTGQTVRGDPAIYAWRNLDSSVAIDKLDDGEDGRHIAAVKVYQNGSGNWVWSFAVHNLNSHKSGNSFSVTAAPGATISNPYFHDVAYHSGEPNSAGTDWTPTITGNTITFNGPTWNAGNDTSANALRWGTLYNFEFQTDLPPSTTGPLTATLGYFRPAAGGAPTQGTFSFDPPTILTLVSGDAQATNVGGAFDMPLVVRAEDLGGTPQAGVTVDFAVTSGSVMISSTQVVTNAAGEASVTATASATAGGASIVTATTETGNVSFNLYTRRLNVNWVPTVGVLVFNFQTESPNTPLAMAGDISSTPVTMTAFGPICTTVLSPGPNFGMVSGLFGVPNAAFDPTWTTNATGTLTKVFTNLTVLNGSGLNIVYQAYGVLGGDIWASNCPVVNF